MKYCPRCGRNLKNTENFCPNCGNLAREDHKTKRATFIFMFVAFLIIGLIREVGRDTNISDVVEETTVKINEEYAQVFADRDLEDVSDLEIMSGRQNREHVNVDESGIVGKIEYSYTHDVILYIVETTYYPMEGFGRDGIKQFDSDIKAETKELNELNFVDITYEMKDDYYMLKVYYRYCDNPSYLSALNETGIVWWAGDFNYIPAREMKRALEEFGYIMK